MLVFFRNTFLPTRGMTADGYTKVGILTKDGLVRYKQFRSIATCSILDVRSKPHKILEPPAPFDQGRVWQYLNHNYRSSFLHDAATHAIATNNTAFFDEPTRLPIHERITTDEHQRRCEVLKNEAKASDILFTFNPSSRMSRLIAWVDCGTWSHTATLLSSTSLCEAIPAGVRNINLEHYLRPPFRLGLFRCDPPAPDPASGIEWARTTVGNKYAFKKAFLAAASKRFGISKRMPLPNDLALSESLQLVCRV